MGASLKLSSVGTSPLRGQAYLSQVKRDCLQEESPEFLLTKATSAEGRPGLGTSEQEERTDDQQEFSHGFVHAGGFKAAHVIEDDEPSGRQSGRQVFKTFLCSLINVHVQVTKLYVMKF